MARSAKMFSFLRRQGNKAEDRAAKYLQDNGYKILCRNYLCPLGEVDIIAQKDETIVFVEVKQRSSDAFGGPIAAVTKSKQQKIAKAVREGNYMSEEELGELKKSSVITVDDVRQINEFLAKKSAGGRWRVVLIDSVDEMNTASANAILKILEEPPHKTLMLLVSHNPNRLLPTIRSRCAKLILKPLQDSVVASLLRRYRPNLSETEIKKLSAMAGGSIGKAIDYADGNAAEYYERISALAASGKNFATADMLKFCDEAADKSYELFKELVLKYLSRRARSLQHIDKNAEFFEKASRIFLETDSLNLDRHLAVMNVMTMICRESQG